MAWTMAQLTAAITALNAPGDSVTQLAALINAQTTTGSIPTSFMITGNQLLNCINWTEFNALTAAQQLNLLTLCSVPGNLSGGSSNTVFLVDGMILAYFTNHSGPTVTALTALAMATVTPTWQPPVTPNDCWIAIGSPA